MFSDVRADKMLLFWKVREHRAFDADRRSIIKKDLNYFKFGFYHYMLLRTKKKCTDFSFCINIWWHWRHSFWYTAEQNKIIFLSTLGIQKGSELDILIGGAGPGRGRGCLQVTFKQTPAILQCCRGQVRGQASAASPRAAPAVRVNTKTGPFRYFYDAEMSTMTSFIISFMSHACIDIRSAGIECIMC